MPVNSFSPAHAGAPARTVGWRHPGYIHTSSLKDIWPDSLYVFCVPYICLYIPIMFNLL